MLLIGVNAHLPIMRYAIRMVNDSPAHSKVIVLIIRMCTCPLRKSFLFKKKENTCSLIACKTERVMDRQTVSRENISVSVQEICVEFSERFTVSLYAYMYPGSVL